MLTSSQPPALRLAGHHDATTTRRRPRSLARPTWAQRTDLDRGEVVHERAGRVDLGDGTPVLLVRVDQLRVDQRSAALTVEPGPVEVHLLGQVLTVDQAAALVADVAALLALVTPEATR
ncbi:hypothetical protein [Kineosporia sp. A_224]|uniref:hypothetical protein n=1 Tax=Kineosporia sp. A_224 TaxID=1962180 RepID=UPI000B4B827D|nr:hypothetical protein [Kineosporia sp. A_224]